MINFLGQVKWLTSILLVLALALPLSASIACGAGTPAGKNLALGKSCVLFPTPNYELCTDPGDPVQLTDGQTTTANTGSRFWEKTGTVGWRGTDYETVTIDLGQIEPIAGVSMTTAAGTADVTWPMSIQVLVSDDGVTYYNTGDLVTADLQKNGPWPEGYAIRRLATDKLQTYGRFVQFVMIPLPGASLMFTDELEVIRGTDALLENKVSRGEPTTAKMVYEDGRLSRALQYRWVQDSVNLNKLINESTLEQQAKNSIADRLKTVEALEPDTLAATPDMRIILPIGPRHEELFKTQAYLWKELGHPDLSVWVPNAWDPLELLTIPPVPTANSIQVDTIQGEYRAAALDLANSTEKPLQVRISFKGLPESPVPNYVTLKEVQWTDTSQCVPVAAALPEASRDNNAWDITVLPGVVRQVWMTFHVTGLPAGEYKGELVIQSPDLPARQVPVHLTVWPLEFPQFTTLLLGGWDYANSDNRGITPQNRTAFLENLQNHFVNAPWSNSTPMMTFSFDKTDPNKIILDTSAFDNWLSQWPQAKAYMVYLNNVEKSSLFGGAAIGTAEFNQRVGTWITAWVSHLKTKGIAPERLVLLLQDEPSEGSDIKPMVAWAKAIRAAEPSVLLWEDPNYKNPAAAPAELFDVSNILCPKRQQWLQADKSFVDFYRGQQTSGHTLQLYSCSGPAKLLDPYSYYRLQAWQAWQIGATGSFFWSFYDNGRTSSWSEYLAKAGGRSPYTPLFLDESSVTDGKQMESIREGVEDYEYFVMLSKAVNEARANGRSDAVVSEAEALLKTAADQVLANENDNKKNWLYPKDRTVADQMRIKILKALVSL